MLSFSIFVIDLECVLGWNIVRCETTNKSFETGEVKAANKMERACSLVIFKPISKSFCSNVNLIYSSEFLSYQKVSPCSEESIGAHHMGVFPAVLKAKTLTVWKKRRARQPFSLFSEKIQVSPLGCCRQRKLTNCVVNVVLSEKNLRYLQDCMIVVSL